MVLKNYLKALKKIYKKYEIMVLLLNQEIEE